jgi:hypothetical protein
METKAIALSAGGGGKDTVGRARDGKADALLK